MDTKHSSARLVRLFEQEPALAESLRGVRFWTSPLFYVPAGVLAFVGAFFTVVAARAFS